MQINLLTTVPEYFESVLQASIIGRAINKKKVKFEILCLRDFAPGRIKKIVDDKPYGGGAGMILKVEPIYKALQALKRQKSLGQVFLTSAKGEIFCQKTAHLWSQLNYLTLICGHYEGVDERILSFIDGEISLGKFVLTGGEAAAAAMIDATVRLLPEVLGNPESLKEESFQQNSLEYPQYTRPEDFLGLKVPEVLLSGHHAEIEAWRKKHRQSLKKKN